MMTNDMTPPGGPMDAPMRVSRGLRSAGIGALSLAIGLVLTGCGQPDGTYIEGYWDNGDPFYAPSKTVLFDDNGDPTCAYPVKYLQFESRSGPTNLARGVSFEIMNLELDPDGYLNPADYPDEASQAKERLRRERALNSLDVLWQYTHPQFDAAYGIESPADLAPIKAELQTHLYGLGKNAPFVDYLKLVEQYFVSDRGTFIVVRLDNPKGYLEDNNIPLKFEGLLYEYYSADDGEEEFLLVKEKETGDTALWQGDQESELTDAIWFARVEVRTGLPTPNGLPPVMAEFTFQSDGCADEGGRAYQRYYLRSYEIIEPVIEDDDEEPAPEPSPSPSV
ncbi:MAG: hypothetical protein JW722_05890 [Demequinaceae bacterium]|nr:hypothetical protein [Demequinaceae bacterium]